MSNKTQLQQNNIKLQDIQTVISEMPTKSEVEEGAKKGLYAWKKYEYVPEISYTDPTFTANVKSDSVEITESSFDLSHINNENYVDFYAGFVRTSWKYMKFSKSSTNGDLLFSNSSNSAYNVSKYDNGIFTVRVSSNTGNDIAFKKTGKIIIRKEIKTLVDFCVSDDPNKYPNGAIHTDGFYYEKVKESVGFECGTVTLSSNITMPVTINHLLGEVPTWAAFIPEELQLGIRNGYTSMYIGNMNINGLTYTGESESYGNPLNPTSAICEKDSSTIKFYMYNNQTSSDYGFPNGKYYWFAIV